MYYLVNVDYNSMAAYFTGRDCEGFEEALYVQCNDDMLWNGSEENGDVRSECEEDEGTDCWRWRQWHWLVKADGIRHALCIKCMKLIVKYFS